MIEVGKTYLTENEGAYTCIFVQGDYSYLSSNVGGVAYVWDTYTGISLSLNSGYNLIRNCSFREA